MKISNQFRVEAAPEAAWALLNDIPEVVPCMPGAELVEVVGEDAWRARLTTKLGAMSFVFDADVTRESADEAARTVVLVAKAKDKSGGGQATARISSTIGEAEGVTSGAIETDLTLAGTIARFGRQGLVEDVSSQLVREFAANLEAKLKAGGGAAGGGSVTGEGGGPAAAPGSAVDRSEPGERGSPPEPARTPAEPREAAPLRAFPLLMWALGRGIKRRLASLWGAIRRLLGGGGGDRPTS